PVDAEPEEVDTDEEDPEDEDPDEEEPEAEEAPEEEPEAEEAAAFQDELQNEFGDMFQEMFSGSEDGATEAEEPPEEEPEAEEPPEEEPKAAAPSPTRPSWPEAPARPSWPETPAKPPTQATQRTEQEIALEEAPSLMELEPLGKASGTIQLQPAASNTPSPELPASPQPTPEPLTSSDPEILRKTAVPGSIWPDGLGVGSLQEQGDALGPGKWLEQGRSVEELTRDLPSTPVREIEIKTGGYPWARFVMVGILAFGLFKVWQMLPKDDSAPDEVNNAQPDEESEFNSVPIQTTRAAAADAPVVTITSNIDNPRVTLDGQDYGRAPTTVPVPTDEYLHELCVQKGTRIRCLNLAGEDLAERDPFLVEIEPLRPTSRD
ncbi:MAG: PEGA domain-containing protein, partial [Myxococcota bacterium]|nr:PEGA domain-containing protein [Myxococcota bacterium]